MEEFVQSFPAEVKKAVKEVDEFMKNWKPKVQVWKNVQIIPVLSMEAAKYAYEHWAPREGDVFVVTFPKCGTHWMKEVVKQVLLIHDQKLMELMSVVGISPLNAQTFIEIGPGAKFMVSDHLPCRRIFITHLPWELVNFRKIKENNAKVIYVYRNPKDHCISYFHLIRNRPRQFSDIMPYIDSDWPTFLNLHISGKIPSSVPEGEWYPYHIKSWLKLRNEDNVLFVAFEDMKQDLSTEVRKVATFLGVERSDDEVAEIVRLCRFDQMKKAAKGTVLEELKVFRKGEVGGWKSYFTVAQSEMMDKKLEEAMKGVDLQFKYEI